VVGRRARRQVQLAVEDLRRHPLGGGEHVLAGRHPPRRVTHRRAPGSVCPASGYPAAAEEVPLLVLTIALAAHAVECTGPIALDDVAAGLTAAESAYADLDDVGFRDRANALAGVLLPCVVAPLPPAMAARFHRVMALHLQALGDEPAAEGAMRAAHAHDPSYAFDDTLLPPTHPLRAAYEAAPAVQLVRKVPEPKAGNLAFDGTIGRLRPKDDPTVVQVLDPAGVALTTAYVGAGDPLPRYDAIARTRTALGVTSGASLGVSAVAGALAWGAFAKLHADAKDQSTLPEVLDADRAATNRLAAIWTVTFAVGVGTGTAAIAVGDR
jgi:hypothetical protein